MKKHRLSTILKSLPDVQVNSKYDFIVQYINYSKQLDDNYSFNKTYVNSSVSIITITNAPESNLDIYFTIPNRIISVNNHSDKAVLYFADDLEISGVDFNPINTELIDSQILNKHELSTQLKSLVASQQLDMLHEIIDLTD